MPTPPQSTILCVDDDRVTLRVIERLLTNNGYTALTAESGEQALQILQTTKPDLILLDVMMPGMDGYEVCAKLQQDKDLSYIPVIFSTAREEEEDKTRAFALGAVDYLVKPTPNDVLLQKVASHLKTKARWQDLETPLPRRPETHASDFLQFKTFLSTHLSLTPAKRAILPTL